MQFCKNFTASGQKMEGFQEFESPKIFCPRADGFSCPPPISGGHWFFLGIFDKIGSNVVVKPHHN